MGIISARAGAVPSRPVQAVSDGGAHLAFSIAFLSALLVPYASN